MTDTTTRIAARVRGIAAEHGYTQRKLATTLGLSRTSVVERIAGRVPFTATEVSLLADAMGEPIDRFFPKVTPERRPTLEAVPA